VLCGLAGFAPLRACTRFVAGSRRLPACSRGRFVSCRFVLVPASWLFWVACLPVVGGLARFLCRLLLASAFVARFWLSCLPVLCGVAGSVPFRGCTCFAARFCRLPASFALRFGLFQPVKENRRKKAQEKRRGKDSRKTFFRVESIWD
jgi:hypothetical protein